MGYLLAAAILTDAANTVRFVAGIWRAVIIGLAMGAAITCAAVFWAEYRLGKLRKELLNPTGRKPEWKGRA